MIIQSKMIIKYIFEVRARKAKHDRSHSQKDLQYVPIAWKLLAPTKHI